MYPQCDYADLPAQCKAAVTKKLNAGVTPETLAQKVEKPKKEVKTSVPHHNACWLAEAAKLFPGLTELTAAQKRQVTKVYNAKYDVANRWQAIATDSFGEFATKATLTRQQKTAVSRQANRDMNEMTPF